MARKHKSALASINNGKLYTPVQYVNESTQVNRQSSSQSSSQSSRENSPRPAKLDKGIQTDKYLNFSNILKFVLAALICGLSFSQIKDFCILNETESCSEKVFINIKIIYPIQLFN